jgi:hypothetical protein
MRVRRSREGTRLQAMRSEWATPRSGSDAEDVARRGRARWLDIEEAPPCGRLVVVRANRVGVAESRGCGGYRGGFRSRRFGDERRYCHGVVAAGCGYDLRIGRHGTRCVVASHRTMVIRSRGAGAPQFTAKRPNGSARQNRHEQQCRCVEHCPALYRGKRSASRNPQKSSETGMSGA